MKKQFLLYTGVQTAAALFFMIFGLFFVKNISVMEVHTVQNLAGSIIPAFPETESVFLQALGNQTDAQREAGSELLSRYGYAEEDFLEKNPLYHQGMLVSLCIFAVLFLFSLFIGYHFFYVVKKERFAQEALLVSLLERCLSDDYEFLDYMREAPSLPSNNFSKHADRTASFRSNNLRTHKKETSSLQSDAMSDAFLKLAQKLRLKSEVLQTERDNTKTLVTDISHQLKTPLAALKSCLSIYMEADSAEEREEFGARCRFQMEKLEHLTASLINISRLENAMIQLKPQQTSLTDIFIEAVNAVYGKAADKQIAIDTEAFSDVLLFLDKKWTAEALFNILDNAVKYSPAESVIQVRVQTLYNFVRVEIEDEGIGIPKEEYNQIFKRFYRGQNSAVQKSEGAGVGLYLSRKILEEQGGTLSVKAAKTRGSVFVVQLPL